MAQKQYRTRLIPLKLKLAAKLGRDISYQDIANATGLSYQTVHRYATKAIPRPDYETVAALARYFSVSVEQFVYEDRPDDMTSESGQAAGPVMVQA